MSRVIAILAALPREIAGLVRGVDADKRLAAKGIFLYRPQGAIVVAAGMGAERVALAVEAALGSEDVETLISVGVAGSCSARLAAGSVAEASVVVEARTGERFRTMCADGPLLATTEAIASVTEKQRLAATYGAGMVDMEAATVARLAAAHGLGFRAIKAVSDGHDFELESLGRFTGRHGSFRVAAFALHTALRPQTWAKAMELGKNSGLAISGLEARLREVLAENAG